MSCYGYSRLTSPHIDKLAADAVLFERTYSTVVPTTPAYTAMLSGLDCFSSRVVGLRHKGPLGERVRMLPEILRDAGYTSTCVGFPNNPASRGFDTYLEYEAWNAETGRCPKAQNLNDVALPELQRLLDGSDPFLLFLRHMDPHSPYLPPAPFERLFYHGDECDPANRSMDPVMEFKPFRDYFASWLPEGISDKDYVVAQYDGAIAYMDAAIQNILELLSSRGVLDDTIIVLNGDHGETLYDHECWFDHHGIYDVTLHVPLVLRFPAKLPAGARIAGYNRHEDLVPTLLQLAGIDDPGADHFDGRSLLPMIGGEVPSLASEYYIAECTWMRKHGWRTPHWKLIIALEPDFHFKPEVELYDLVTDPAENHNVAEERPEVVAALRERMEAYIAQRERETGLPNPMSVEWDWHGIEGLGPFTSSQQAYDSQYLGSRVEAQRLQDKPG